MNMLKQLNAAIEVLHLWTEHDLRQKNRYYEVWIPVELKQPDYTQHGISGNKNRLLIE